MSKVRVVMWNLFVMGVIVSAATAEENSYYKFSEDGKECIIKRYDTPVGWLNLLGNDRFVAWANHNGNVPESCLLDNKKNRLTNPKSGYFYIRDAETGEYFMLNKPKDGAAWHSAQGLGYTRVTTSCMGLTVTGTYFVPREDDVLLWLISIRNDGMKKRKLDVFSLVQWCLGDPHYGTVLGGGDFFGIHNNFKIVTVDNNIIYGTNNTWGVEVPGQFQGQKAWPYMGYFTSSLPLKGFDCEDVKFFGRTGDIDDPEAVKRGACSGSGIVDGFTEFPLGVLHNEIKLKPGVEEKLVVMLGISKHKKTAAKTREKYLNPKAAECALRDVKNFWDKFIDETIVIETPDKENDRLINIWCKYQYRASMQQNLNTGRKGSGVWTPAYPYGGGRWSDMREVANIPCDPDLIKEHVLDYLEGGPLLLKSDLRLKWSPWGCNRKPNPYPGNGRGMWPFAISWYVKETGDLSFLDTKVTGREETVFDRMKKTVENALSGLSARNLPRMNPGIGDWDDALNLISRDGRGETILTAVELCYMLKESAEIADAHGKTEEAKEWMQKYDDIKQAVNTHAWDGQWYIRAITEEGELVGSSQCDEGKIFLVVQAIAVLSGVAETERAQQCLQASDDMLMTEIGPINLAPTYTKSNDHVGIVTDFPIGWRENSGVWNRITGWAVTANCLIGRADSAYRMYKNTSLCNVAKDVDRFWCPPYAYPEYYVGAGHAFGRGQYQWCMGKAGTMWRAYVHFILGVRPVLEGLLVDPQIPSDWDGFKVTRPFRGAIYKIEVVNPNELNMGVKSVVVDGKTIKGNVIPSYGDGKTHTVKVVLGK